MTSELLGALDEAIADDAVRVIVLTGEGKAFCAGGDFGQMTDGTAAAPLRGDYVDLLLALWRSQKPVVARVNGHAMGGGLGLVAASTFAIAADGALLGTPEIEVGLFPMMIMAVLSRLTTRRRLVEMMLLGQKLSAAEAKEVGLVGRVVSAEGLDAAVDELVKCASRARARARCGWGSARWRITRTASSPLRCRCSASGSPSACRPRTRSEGLTAFLEKRAPCNGRDADGPRP